MTTEYTAVATKAAGNTLAAADWNTYLRDNLDAIAIAKWGFAYNTIDQSIPNATPTQVVWGASYSLQDFGLSGNALSPSHSGFYVVDVHCTWPSNSTGYRKVEAIVQSRTLSLGKDIRQAVSGEETTNHLSCPVFLVPGDTIDVTVTQTSGGALNLSHNWMYTRFSVTLFTWGT